MEEGEQVESIDDCRRLVLTELDAPFLQQSSAKTGASRLGVAYVDNKKNWILNSASYYSTMLGSESISSESGYKERLLIQRVGFVSPQTKRLIRYIYMYIYRQSRV